LGEILGFIGGTLTTVSFIPQLIQVFKLKSAREISLLFTTLLLAGILTWLVYGIYSRLMPVIVANAVGGVLNALLLYAKLKYG
jgi:MtN3 and saliva related transmembrane protein